MRKNKIRKIPDIFKKKKGIHLQLDTDTHTLFRRELFMTGLTMQEALEAFARLVASGDHRTKKMLEAFVTNKIRLEIEELKISANKEPPKFGELDSETLYNLINDLDEQVIEEKVKKND